MAFNPVLLAAMSDVEPSEAGLASGVVNTSFMMGGALGLAVLASLAASRTDSLLSSGEGHLAALTGGYHLAFLAGADLRVIGGRARRHAPQGPSPERRDHPGGAGPRAGRRARGSLGVDELFSGVRAAVQRRVGWRETAPARGRRARAPSALRS